MIFRKLAELLCLVIIIAALGCDSRSAKPAPAIPKKTPKVEESWPEINRAEVEAAQSGAQRPPQRPPQQAPEPAARPAAPTPPVAESKPTEPVPDGSGSLPWVEGDGSQLPMEYWEVQYFNAQRIGITRYRIELAGRGLKIRIETNMQIALPDRLMRQTIVIDTTEQMDGRMELFSETLNSDAGSSTTDATVNFGELRMAGKNGKKHIPWPDGSWGPMGIHQLLMRKPMKPGEVRQAKVFMPQLHQLALVTLRAGQPEDTTSPDGLLANVTPIDAIMQLDKEGIRVRMWTDAAGRVQKTIWPEGLNLISFRISSEVARRLQSEVDIESYRDVTLTYTAADAVTADQSQVQYEVTSEQADPHTLFSTESNQVVQGKSVYETLVTVYRPAWQGAAPAEARQTAPSLKELSGSNWLPAEDAAIRRLAEQWGGTATAPAEVAQALLQGVHKHMRKLEFNSTIQSVETTAQNLEGDCTEHAMLLAALLRNRQIPARIASGVRLHTRDGQPKFEYHMWTEAWLGDHWIPMDATVGQLTSCAYIKFIDTSLADSDPYDAVLTVLRSLKSLKVSK